MRSWIAASCLALALTAGAGTALAAKPACHDASGKFVKCSAPGAIPASSMPNKAATTTTTAAAMPNKAPPSAAAASSAATPAAATVGAPAGATTAKCKDGTTSTSKTHSGACSHHGGVASWVGP